SWSITARTSTGSKSSGREATGASPLIIPTRTGRKSRSRTSASSRSIATDGNKAPPTEQGADQAKPYALSARLKNGQKTRVHPQPFVEGTSFHVNVAQDSRVLRARRGYLLFGWLFIACILVLRSSL